MKKFAGVTTAIITPFYEGKIDLPSFTRLIADQVKRGVQGLVINGTTAESPTVSKEERTQLFQAAREATPKGFPLIMGTGTNSTAESIQQSQQAEKLGADAVLVVVPYYNKPPQRGLLEHYKAIADAVKIPVILYNVPGRTITALELETIKKLSAHPNIIGIKEASGNITFAKQIREACGREFLLLSGDDATYDDFMAAGGDGVISVASHIIPEAFVQKRASQYLDLINALFIEANPIPVKMAVHLAGLIKSAEMRLPLVTASEQVTEKLRVEMRKQGLLS